MWPWEWWWGPSWYAGFLSSFGAWTSCGWRCWWLRSGCWISRRKYPIPNIFCRYLTVTICGEACPCPHSVVVTLFWIGQYGDNVFVTFYILLHFTHWNFYDFDVGSKKYSSGYFNSTLNPVIYVMTNRLFCVCKKLFLGLSACIQYDRDHRQGLQVCVHWYPQEAFLLMLSGNVLVHIMMSWYHSPIMFLFTSWCHDIILR